MGGVNPSCLDLIADWVRATYPKLRIGGPPDPTRPLALYVPSFSTEVWKVSIAFWPNDKICAWNSTGSFNYLIWLVPADPQLFEKLKDFIDRSIV